MIEIVITYIIVILAVFILIKSMFNSKNGKCNCGCDKCSTKNKCIKRDDN